MRRTKIVATIGPASREPETRLRMVQAGMDVARLSSTSIARSTSRFVNCESSPPGPTIPSSP